MVRVHCSFMLPSLFWLSLTLTPGGWAQEAPSLYNLVSPHVSYLRHELYLDGSQTKQAALWKRLEIATKSNLLNTYLPLATGSGFFVDDQGRMITNRHVVQIANLEALRTFARSIIEKVIDDPSSRLSGSDKGVLKADLAAIVAKGRYRFAAWNGSQFLGSVKILLQSAAQDVDLALVEVTGHRGGSLELAGEGESGSNLVGLDVASFGYPLGDALDAMFKERVATMNRGSISAVRSTELLDLQHSAAISRGNSGGPLVDTSGRVVGVNTAGFDASQGNSLFYAVSANRIRAFLGAHGYRDVLLWNQRLAKTTASQKSGGVATVEFRSDPSGARVVADGRVLGSTPVTVDLTPGSYSVSWTLQGQVFLPKTLTVDTSSPIVLSVTGAPAQRLRISLPAPAHQPAKFTFRGADGEYFAQGDAAFLPVGQYTLSVAGVLGLAGVEIPVTIVEEPETLNLAPFYRLSDLTIRGWEPGALLVIDGYPFTLEAGVPASLPMGVHTVSAWKDGRQPLLPIAITVREPGVAFVTWKKFDGFEVQRDRAFWSGITLTGLGAAAAGVGWYFGRDEFAVPHATSYRDYSNWKATMGMVLGSGVGTLVVGVALDLAAGVLHSQYEAQRKEFGR